MSSRFNPTAEMRSAAAKALIIARGSAEALIAGAEMANRTIVDLPFTNDDGTQVLHGANQRMRFIRDEILSSFNALQKVIGRDYADKLRYSFKYAALGYTARFHSDEQWALVGAHLDAELVKIEARIGTDQEIF